MQSAPPAQSALVPVLEEAVNQRRKSLDHSLCRQLREEHAQLVSQIEQSAQTQAPAPNPPSPSAGANGRPARPKRARLSAAVSTEHFERILRLEADLIRYCHDVPENGSSAETCALMASGVPAELQADYNKWAKKDVCQVCNGRAAWLKPLYACLRPHAAGPVAPNADVEAPPYYFHLECGKYPANTPFGTKLFCPDCFKDRALAQSMKEDPFRRQHVWEHCRAAGDLYNYGFRIVAIPEDGLCFFTVLYLMVQQYVYPPLTFCLFLRDPSDLCFLADRR